MIRRTTMPSSLVEMGFVTGRLDAARLQQPDFRRRMALALAAAILDYLGGGMSLRVGLFDSGLGA